MWSSLGWQEYIAVRQWHINHTSRSAHREFASTMFSAPLTLLLSIFVLPALLGARSAGTAADFVTMRTFSCSLHVAVLKGQTDLLA